MTALAALAAALLSGCLDPPPPVARTGAERMAERLRLIVTTADPMVNEYANDLRAEILRENHFPDVRREHTRRFQLARELLRAGETEASIEIFEALLSDMPPGDAGKRQRLTIRSWLGLAFLRLGEQENCLLRHDIDSCLLPIRESGIHQAQRGSRGAIEQFEVILRS